MKTLLIILTLFFAASLQAATYYVDNTFSGTSTGASDAPFNSIGDVNTKFGSLAAGDQILFKKGQTFYGTITINKSGTQSQPITIGAYGTGAKPIITGFTALTSWTSAGTNIYKATAGALSGITYLKTVLINNTIQGIGRWPNSDWNIWDVMNTSNSARYYMTDAPLSSQPNYLGAEVVLRTTEFTIQKRNILSHSGSVISFDSTQYTPVKGIGYFIQNHLSTLDQPGEWYFKPSTDELFVYSTSTPTNVKAATLSKLVYSTGQSHFIIRDIEFQGANGDILDLANSSGTSDIQVLNCDAKYGDGAVVFANPSDAAKVRNCYVRDCFVQGIRMPKGDYDSVTDNTLRAVEIIAGLGDNGPGAAALRSSGSHSYCAYNDIDSCGSGGIIMAQNYSTVYRNLGNNYGMLKQDYGFIYVRGSHTSTGVPIDQIGQVVEGNIILGGHDSRAGTTQTHINQHHIYFDDWSNNALVKDNSCFNSPRSGFYGHNSHHMTLTGNTFFNNNEYGILFAHDGIGSNSPSHDEVLNNNIIFAKESTQYLLWLESTANDFNNLGTLDYNTYARPINEPLNSVTKAGGVVRTGVSYSSQLYYSLDKWKSAYNGFDVHSKMTAKQITNTNQLLAIYNASKDTTYYNTTSTYVDAKGVSYTNGHIQLAPYTSKILIITPDVPLVTSTNILPSVSITSPTANAGYTAPADITLTATASDADGTVSNVKFYNGTTLLATVNSSPYSYTWSSVASGNYTITARATDNSGDSKDATLPVSVGVTTNTIQVIPRIKYTSINSVQQ